MNLDRNITSNLRRPHNRLGQLVRLALVALPLLGWAIWLRPEFAGGRVDYIIVGGESTLPALHGGDLAMVERESAYRVGNIVAYHIPSGVFHGLAGHPWSRWRQARAGIRDVLARAPGKYPSRLGRRAHASDDIHLHQGP